MELRPKPILLLYRVDNAPQEQETLKGREIHLFIERFGPQEGVDWKVIRPDPMPGTTTQLALLCERYQATIVVCKHDYQLPFLRPPGIELLQFKYGPEYQLGQLVDYPRQLPARKAA